MLETRRAAPDGVHAQIYEIGKAYEVPDELARMWFSSHRAEEDKMADGPSETKDIQPAPVKTKRKPKWKGAGLK